MKLHPGGVRMSATAIGRDDALELCLKALRLPSFLEQYLELANVGRGCHWRSWHP